MAFNQYKRPMKFSAIVGASPLMAAVGPSPTSSVGVAPKRTKRDETTPEGNVASYRIIKRINLTEGKSITLTYENSQMVMVLGNLGSLTNESEGPLMKIYEEALMSMLAAWENIYNSYRSKQVRTLTLSNGVGKEGHVVRADVILSLGYIRPETGEFGMKIEIPSCTNSKLLLSIDDLEKMSRCQTYMVEHANFLLQNRMCYNIMQDEILRCIRTMGGKCEYITSNIEELVTLGLNKPIIDAFQLECAKQGLTCSINVYALYAFCIGQASTLEYRWEEQEGYDKHSKAAMISEVVEASQNAPK
jgi:hypothetical protein